MRRTLRLPAPASSNLFYKKACALFILALFCLGASLEATTAWRGMGQRMRVAVQGWNGGGAWSRLTRSRHYSASTFRRFRIVLQTFQPGIASPLADTNYTNDYAFQVGFEYPYTAGNTGIAPRVAVTFGGSNVGTYTSTNGPYGYLLSDIIDLGYDVPTNAFFGLWTTIENLAGPLSASNTLPYIDNMCNLFERYEGSTGTPSSLIGSNWALTRSNISHVGTNIGGYSAGYAPTMMLIEVDEYEKSVLLVGDSICYGVGEGAGGSAGYGDALGSALGNSGYLARWLGENLHYNYVNLGRGSDGFKFATANNWKYRYQLMALANPTHVVSENLHNDCYSNANLIQTIMSNTYQAIRALCPGAPILQTCCTPNTDSSLDQYATTNNQVPTAVFRLTNQTRNVINQRIRALSPSLGHDGFIDPNPIIEAGYLAGDPSTITSLWKADGTPYGFIYDGVHPNSHAAAVIAAGLTYNPFIPTNLIGPTGAFSSSPSNSALAGTSVVFSNLTTAGTGAVTNWAWDFGNGTASNWASNLGRTACAYTNAGTFTIRLTVRDRYGLTNTASLALTITNAAGSNGAPPAPAVLSAVEWGASAIRLDWSASAGADAYRIDRGLDGTNYAALAVLPAGSASWTDSSVIPFVAYYYRVAATNSLGETAASIVFATARRASLRGGPPAFDIRGGKIGFDFALTKNFPEAVALSWAWAKEGSSAFAELDPAQWEGGSALGTNATNAKASAVWRVPELGLAWGRVHLKLSASVPGTDAAAWVFSNLDLGGFFRQQGDLKSACVVGSPWRGGAPILFANLAADTRVKIYSVAGSLVAEPTGTGGSVLWNPGADSRAVPPGIYLARLSLPSGETRMLKLMLQP